MTTSDLRSIVSSSGGLVLDASKYTASDLRGIAESASGNHAPIFLKNISKFTASDLRSIASSGKGTVIFDFTN